MKWELCTDLMEELGYGKTPNWPKKTKKIASEVNNIDDVWRQFYRLQLNGENGDVSIFSLHQTLLTRGIQPMVYLRQEFDWVR